MANNYVFPSQGEKKRKKRRKSILVFWPSQSPKSGFSSVGSLAKGQEADDLISKGYLTYFTLEFENLKKKGENLFESWVRYLTVKPADGMIRLVSFSRD